MISEIMMKRLIELGKRKDIDKPSIAETFSDLKDIEEVYTARREDWEYAVNQLSTKKVISLLKGLTIAEQRFRWGCGSVSPAIWVYRSLEDRDPAMAKEVADWVVRRSSNSYLISTLPYDIRLRASIPYETRAKLDRLSAAEREKWYQDFVQSQREAAARFLEEKRIRRERNLAIERDKQEAREKKRQEHLKKVEDRKRIILNAGKEDTQARLRVIACHTEIPMNFFPREWGNVDVGILQTMDEETRRLLRKRIKRRRDEPWRTLFLSL